jgi:hypothetical protein
MLYQLQGYVTPNEMRKWFYVLVDEKELRRVIVGYLKGISCILLELISYENSRGVRDLKSGAWTLYQFASYIYCVYKD